MAEPELGTGRGQQPPTVTHTEAQGAQAVLWTPSGDFLSHSKQ